MITDPLDDDDDDVGGKLKILQPKKKVNRADPMVLYVEQVRKLLQDEADAEGQGEVVSWHKAEWVAKKVLERQRPSREGEGGSTGSARPMPERRANRDASAATTT